MQNDKIKALGRGRVFAQVAGRELTFEGKIKQVEGGSVFVDDVRSGRLIELSADAVKQIIWASREEPTEAPKKEAGA